ncbi:MAG: CrcB family protein [Bacteriovoracaceae bacterium]|jgi:fluoride exporter|nr:CrcB family protein [Bacteriovoracaceae bacterium]
MFYLQLAGFGALGILSRYFFGIVLSKYSFFPFSTLAVNIIGAFLMGILFSTCDTPTDLHKAIAIGFLGGLTTFSSFSFESYQLWIKGEHLLFCLYFLGSPVLGLIGVIGGVSTGKLLNT